MVNSLSAGFGNLAVCTEKGVIIVPQGTEHRQTCLLHIKNARKALFINCLSLVVSAYEDNRLYAFKYDGDGQWLYEGWIECGGGDATDIAASFDRRLLISVSETSGMITAISLDELGIPDKLMDGIAAPGKHGPNRLEQRYSRPCCVRFDAKGNNFIVCDKGNDQLTTFTVEKGRIERISELLLRPAGCPSEIVFSSDGKYIYILQQGIEGILVCEYSEASGTLTPIQMKNPLPEDYVGLDVYCNNMTVYLGNRLLFSSAGIPAIGEFSVGKDGRLSAGRWRGQDEKIRGICAYKNNILIAVGDSVYLVSYENNFAVKKEVHDISKVLDPLCIGEANEFA